jgi:hypothetical protein
LYHILDTIRIINEKFFLIVLIPEAKILFIYFIFILVVDIYPFFLNLLYKFIGLNRTKIEKKCPDSAIFIIHGTTLPL